MKATLQSLCRLLPCLLLAAALSLPGAVHGALPSPLCLGRQAADFAERLQEAHARLVQQLTARIQQQSAKIISGRRFRHLPEEEREGEALSQVMGSTAYADEVARANGGAGIGEKTAQEFQFAMLNDRVLDSNKTSLTDAAAGVGLLSARTGMDDTKMAALIKNSQKGFTNTTFTGTGYTEAEWYADCQKAFNGNPDLKMSPGAQSTLQKMNNSSGAGDLFEMRAAAHMTDAEAAYGKVLMIGADAAGGGFPNGSKVDIVTDKCLVQCGLTAGTVRDKLKDRLDTTAAGVVEALSQEQAAGKKFIFMYSGEITPVGGLSGAEYYAEELNKELIRIGHSNFANFSAANFVSVPFP